MNEMIMNLTEHDLVIVLDNGKKGIVEPSGVVARCGETSTPCGAVAAKFEDDKILVPVSKKSFGKVENLPPRTENNFYFVSALVAQNSPDRDDLLFPGETIRDDRGRVTGLKSFAVFNGSRFR